MFRAMDIDGPGKPFVKNINPWAAVYFVIAAALRAAHYQLVCFGPHFELQ